MSDAETPIDPVDAVDCSVADGPATSVDESSRSDGDKRKCNDNCEGHIDCPNCGEHSCAKPVIWQETLYGREVDTVVCLGCYQRFCV